MKSKEEKIFILDELKKLYPNPNCELDFTTNFELLVAVILSAQCTDKRVNLVTPNLFARANTPEQMAEIPQKELEQIIYSCGFYAAKAANIIACSKKLVSDFGGEVPQTREELCTLAGVGRKTANVILSVAFDKPAIAVDTHVFRVANRLGVVQEKSPEATEFALMKEFEEKEWAKLHYRMVLFGRRVCDAKKPQCATCPLQSVCKFYNTKK